MKRRISFLITVIFFIGITACNSAKQDNNTSNTSDPIAVVDSVETSLNSVEAELDNALEGLE